MKKQTPHTIKSILILVSMFLCVCVFGKTSIQEVTRPDQEKVEKIVSKIGFGYFCSEDME